MAPPKEPDEYTIMEFSSTLHPNGTLEEVYTYRVKRDGELYVLSRSWNIEVRFARGGERVIPIDINVTPSEGCIGYACSSLGQIEMYHGRDYTIYHSKYIKRNEMGIYCRDGFKKGIYVVRYLVRIYPPLLKGTDGYLLHLTLSDDGSAYEKASIRLVGFKIKNLWLPHYMEAEGGDNLTIRTKKRTDGPLTMAVLLRNLPENFTNYGATPVKSAYREGRWEIMKVNMLYIYSTLLYRIVKYYYLSFPLFFLFLYILLGREKDPGEAENTLLLPPQKRPPWLVSYIFHKYGEGDIPPEGLLATILDMRRKKIIELEGDRIFIISEHTRDPIERRVLRFLKRLSGDGEISLSSIKTTGPTRSSSELVQELKELIKTDDEIQKYKDEFIEDLVPWAKYLYSIPTMFFLLMACTPRIFASAFQSTLEYATIYTLLGLSVAAVDDPIKRPLITRWRHNYYQEKLLWDAFREGIKRMKIYPESANDSLVQDWLIYGTALGVGKEASEALLSYTGTASTLLVGYTALKDAFLEPLSKNTLQEREPAALLLDVLS